MSSVSLTPRDCGVWRAPSARSFATAFHARPTAPDPEVIQVLFPTRQLSRPPMKVSVAPPAPLMVPPPSQVTRPRELVEQRVWSPNSRNVPEYLHLFAIINWSALLNLIASARISLPLKVCTCLCCCRSPGLRLLPSVRMVNLRLVTDKTVPQSMPTIVVGMAGLPTTGNMNEARLLHVIPVHHRAMLRVRTNHDAWQFGPSDNRREKRNPEHTETQKKQW